MQKFRDFIKKVLYAVGANLLSLIVSCLTTLLIPKVLGERVDAFGYFQVYWFYNTYVGFFHFGLCDGILLKDGGKEYSKIDKSLYSSQFWLLTSSSFFMAVIISLVGLIFAKDSNYLFIFIAFAFDILLMMPRNIVQYCLQATNRIKEYASITTLGRSVFGISLIASIFVSPNNFHYFVVCDLFGKLCALAIGVFWCKDMIIAKPVGFKTCLSQAGEYISVGIKLLFANISGMLITGIVRGGIQMHWDIETYGKISLTLSISNLFMVFLSAIAVVLYPSLKRLKEDVLPRYYMKIRDVVILILFGALLVYYPISMALFKLLPQYAEGLKYMSMLFPLCIFAAKMSMLVQTYMQVYRMEKDILLVNILGVICSVVCTAIFVFVLHNLTLAMFSILLNQVLRCEYAEYKLSKRLCLNLKIELLYDIVISALFVLFNIMFKDMISMMLYFIVFIIYILLNRKRVKNSVVLVKETVTKS